jgi:hypothetical protein
LVQEVVQMPLEFMGRAPYAPSSAIVQILSQHRKTPIAKFDALVLDRQVAIPESLIPRTLVALQLLGFADADNNALPEFTALARVPEADLKPAVADILRVAYAPVIAALGGDPAVASPDQITAAFRSYNPLGQLERMVQLFTGLMSYVGMMPETTRRRGSGDGSTRGKVSGNGATVQTKSKQDEKPFVPFVPPLSIDAYSRCVTLDGNAGTIMLSGTVNPFALKGASREFVFAMIDLMDEYDEKSTAGGGNA